MKLTTIKPRLTAISTARLKPAQAQVTERKRGSAGVKDRESIKMRDCGMCVECHRKGATRRGWIVDHRIPLWDGGSDEPENKQTLCIPCHDAKSKVEAGLRAKGESVPRPHGVSY